MRSIAGRSNGRMFYYTYVLRSKKDKELYIGWCKDLKLRFKQHKNGLVKATKQRLPMELIYYEGCLDEKFAIKREKQLKTGFGRAYLKRRLNI
jgi:putative endonuclease